MLTGMGSCSGVHTKEMYLPKEVLDGMPLLHHSAPLLFCALPGTIRLREQRSLPPCTIVGCLARPHIPAIVSTVQGLSYESVSCCRAGIRAEGAGGFPGVGAWGALRGLWLIHLQLLPAGVPHTAGPPAQLLSPCGCLHYRHRCAFQHCRGGRLKSCSRSDWQRLLCWPSNQFWQLLLLSCQWIQ
jgi:hypothetical protein